MKKLIAISLIATALVACNKTNFNLHGVVQNSELNGKTIYIADLNDKNIDSAVIKNNKFDFAFDCESQQLVYLMIKDMPTPMPVARIFILEEGKMSATIDSLNVFKVTGTADNEILNSYFEANMNLDKKMENASKMSKDAIEELNREYIETGYNFAKENANNLVGKFAFLNTYWLMTIEQKENVVALLKEEYKTDEKIAKIIENLPGEKRSAEGEPYIDLTLMGVDGKEIKLSSLVGKTDYLLIDFWASWCRPCLNSMPALKDLYDKNRGKKLQIVGISLDSNGENWRSAIKTYNLNWLHFSDLKKWDSPSAKMYSVSFIPNTILLDKNGIIVARNKHVNEIEDIINSKK